MNIRFALMLALLAHAGVSLARPAPPPVKQETVKGFRAEFLVGIDDMQRKLIGLAKAVPAEKYSWRPAAGIRSISEVFMHSTGGNYFLSTFLGVRPPANVPTDLERITDKQAVIAELEKSFDHVRNTARNASDADLEKGVMLFGNATTQRVVYVTMLNHLHEHLGQAIAYARMNGVAPPWSGRE